MKEKEKSYEKEVNCNGACSSDGCDKLVYRNYSGKGRNNQLGKERDPCN